MSNCKSLLLRCCCTASIVLGSTAYASNEETGAGDGSPFASRIGWVDTCLAIQNDTLQPGTPVTVLMFGEDEHLIAQRVLTQRVAGKILGRTTSAVQCPALIEDRRSLNEEEGYTTFYTLSLDGGVPSTGAFGVGILGLEDQGNIDLDGGGAPDSFTVCRAYNGFSFAAWSAEPRVGKPLWEAAYYTGGEGERDCTPDPDLPDVPEKAVSPFDSRIGWVDKCLAIGNQTLKPGTPLTILSFVSDADRDAPQKILKRRVAGKIVAKTTSPDKCPALSEKRWEGNEWDDVSFYTLALDDGPTDAALFGIGILGLEPNEPIDLDGDGTADSFTACPSIELIHFSAWKGAPHEAAPLWDGYDYLGYDTLRTDCPFASSQSQPAGPPELWSFEFRIGWVYGGCLGVYNTIIQPGTAVTIALSDTDNKRSGGTNILGKRIAGKILGRTDSGEDCPDLAKDVRDWNKRSDIGYYRVALENGESLTGGALGIGVVLPGDGPIDLDQNGVPDRYSVCNTKESTAYIAWPGEPSAKPREEDPLWTNSLYLGHRLKGLKDCPKALGL